MPGEDADLVVRFEDWEEWDSTTPFWRHAAAGSCAGVMEHIGMYPLDTVKTHLQALRPGVRLRAYDVVRDIYNTDSGLGFMRGASAIASGCIPAHIALFTTYESSKKHLLSQGGDHEPFRAALCGASSTFCHDLILTPMDVVKQRMQLGCHRSIGSCLQAIWRTEGLSALFRSMPTTLAMNVPFGSVLVAVNESLKLHLGIANRQSSHSSLLWYFLCAGISGAIASGATQPLDVVKTRLQTQDLLVASASQSPSSSSSPSASPQPGSVGFRPKYSGFCSAVATIIREEGGLALYNGLLVRMLHATPAAALCWGTYETVKSLLNSPDSVSWFGEKDDIWACCLRISYFSWGLQETCY
jgi:solute carrier family 25 iron transporter 28/37